VRGFFFRGSGGARARSASRRLSLSPTTHTQNAPRTTPNTTNNNNNHNSGFLSASGPAGAAAAAADPPAAAADALTIVTDARSNKVGECALNPRAEVCWYFPKTREQFRVSGTLEIVGPAPANEGGKEAGGGDSVSAAPPSRLALLRAAREGAWQRMSEAGREQFFWPHPGQPRLGGDEEAFLSESGAGKKARGGAPAADAPPPPPPPPVPPTFCLGLIEADEVDHVRLTTNRRTRYVLGAGGEWSVEEVNP
jgi:pyridoxamine 5'-phosphate oxidase